MVEKNKVVLSGMRPTGRLHIGHYEGALKNYLQLQASGASCYFMIADWHALSTDYKQPKQIGENTRELLLDWLAIGLDAEKVTIFVQSEILEHAELFVLLGMLTPLAWTERCPTYKEQQQELADKDLSTYGFLGYPILQAADILLYRATHVPVGQDQLPHLEIAREIARRLNYLYGDILPEPQALLTSSPKLPGIDGRKMSKSYGNAILLSDEPKTLTNKVMQMYTDPNKLRANTPGNPDNCVVLEFYKIYFSQLAEVAEKECKAGQRGCVVCKRGLIPKLIEILEPILEKRNTWATKGKVVDEILDAGLKQARLRAKATMKIIREHMGWLSGRTER